MEAVIRFSAFLSEIFLRKLTPDCSRLVFLLFRLLLQRWLIDRDLPGWCVLSGWRFGGNGLPGRQLEYRGRRFLVDHMRGMHGRSAHTPQGGTEARSHLERDVRQVRMKKR